jgi:hypothetical protein
MLGFTGVSSGATDFDTEFSLKFGQMPDGTGEVNIEGFLMVNAKQPTDINIKKIANAIIDNFFK